MINFCEFLLVDSLYMHNIQWLKMCGMLSERLLGEYYCVDILVESHGLHLD